MKEFEVLIVQQLVDLTSVSVVEYSYSHSS